MPKNKNDRLYAAKVIRKRDGKNPDWLEQEYSALLKYMKICRAHDELLHIRSVHINDEEGWLCYVMELADEILSDVLVAAKAKARGLPWEGCLEVGLGLTACLECLHQHGLIHRDVKPANIGSFKGRWKLLDIGLVTSMGSNAGWAGTAPYMTKNGWGKPSAECVALARVLYELLTGWELDRFPRLPLEIKEKAEKSPAILKLHRIIKKACHKQASKRFESARAMHQALLEVQKDDARPENLTTHTLPISS